MSTRTIEITAKTEEEARGIANGELNDNEMIVSSETISAPARGIFGFVGKQEYKVRFSIGEKPEQKMPEEKIAHSSDENDDVMPVKSFSRRESEDPRPPRRNQRPRSHGDRENGRSRNPRRPPMRDFDDAQEHESINLPERPKEEVSQEIKNHPSYKEIFDLIKAVADNVGVPELSMIDYIRDGAWVIEASGENVSQLIGKRGRTLDSLQYLMNIIFNKGNDDRTKLVLDVQGYREKRYRNLIMLANRMCRKALTSRRQVELEPMSTLDRRTIHMALKDRTDIETFSKGVEPMRRVVISPVKKRKNNINADWQPLTEESDSDFSEKLENTSSVPMFMEEDV